MITFHYQLLSYVTFGMCTSFFLRQGLRHFTPQVMKTDLGIKPIPESYSNRQLVRHSITGAGNGSSKFDESKEASKEKEAPTVEMKAQWN